MNSDMNVCEFLVPMFRSMTALTTNQTKTKIACCNPKAKDRILNSVVIVSHNINTAKQTNYCTFLSFLIQNIFFRPRYSKQSK